MELKEKLIPILAKECKKQNKNLCNTILFRGEEIIKPYVDYIKNSII